MEGAVQAGAAFALFGPLILEGTLFTWLPFVTEDNLPGIFPISGKWRFVLFGLTAIQFARHPEGMVEFGKRRATHKRNERYYARDAARAAQAGDAS